MRQICFCGVLAVLASAVLAGCTTTSASNTARTAKEQMLLSSSVDQSLDKVDFTPLYGQRVFLEEKYLDCVDKGYVLGSIRHRIMRSGGILSAAADDADVVMELRSGGLGTDTTDSYLGVPEITLPGMLTLPEVRMAERKTQFAYAKIGIVLYDAKSRQVLGDGGMAMARTDDSNWSVLGVGPYQSGSLKGEVTKTQMVPPGVQRRQIPSLVALGTRQHSAVETSDAANPVRFASDGKPQPVPPAQQ